MDKDLSTRMDGVLDELRALNKEASDNGIAPVSRTKVFALANSIEKSARNLKKKVSDV